MNKLLYLTIFLPLIIGFTISYLYTNDKSFEKNNETKPFWQPPGYMFSIIWSILYLLNGYALYTILCNSKKFNKVQFGIIILLFILQLVLENYWIIYTSQINQSDIYQLIILFTLIFIIILRVIYFSILLLPYIALLLSPEILWLSVAISLQAYNLKIC
jgi:benzodiazapine receptor